MSEEVQIDQEVFDKAIGEGKSERVARALGKSAWVRKNRPKPEPAAAATEAEAAPAATAAPAAPAGNGDAAAAAPVPAGVGAPAAGYTERLTPEQRAARVAAATGQRATEGASGARSLTGEQTQRLLAVVPPSGIQRVSKRQDDKVNTWPHLLSAEFVAILVVMAFLLAFSAYWNAPMDELANPSLTPNPSKAPWYFLGLQELLRYFHPMVAGVTIPGLGLIGLMTLPYVDKNPSIRPDRRKLALILFTTFMMFWAVLTIIGVHFRGPGYNFTWPWNDGVFFDL